MFGGNLASLFPKQNAGARRKRSGSRKRTGSRKSGGGGIMEGALGALQNTAKAQAQAPAKGGSLTVGPTAPMSGGKRTRRLRKRTGHAKRRSARAHSAGGRRRQRGGNKHVPLAPANL
jgi:hypothetical protein